MPYFVADHPFQGDGEGELQLKVGDEVLILDDSDSDWHLGEDPATKRKGWFPPTFGHVLKETLVLEEGGKSKDLPAPISITAVGNTDISYEEKIVEEKATTKDHIGINKAILKKDFHVAGDYPTSNKTMKKTNFGSQNSNANLITGKDNYSEAILKDIYSSEESYVRDLKYFQESFIDVVHLRNTEDKRRIYEDRGMAVTIQLIQTLLPLHESLFESIKAYKQKDDGGKCIFEGLKAFAFVLEEPYVTYVTEYSNLLKSLHSLEKTINNHLKTNPLNIELSDPNIGSILSLPYDRFNFYYEKLQGLVSFVEKYENNSFAKHPSLEEAFSAISEVHESITEKREEAEHKFELLLLQTKFIGSVDIYQPGRYLVKEGSLTKVKFDVNEKNETKKKTSTIYSHLFNDSLIYSKAKLGGIFKLQRVIDLSTCSGIQRVENEGENLIEIVADDNTSTNGNKTVSFLYNEEWFQAIEKQFKLKKGETYIQQSVNANDSQSMKDKNTNKKKHRNKRSSFSSFSPEIEKAIKVNDQTDIRSKIVIYLLRSEAFYLSNLQKFCKYLVDPLDDLADGANFDAVENEIKVEIEKLGNETNGIEHKRRNSDSGGGLFTSKTHFLTQITSGSIERLKNNEMSRFLQTSEMSLFLKTFPQLCSLSGQLLTVLEEGVNKTSKLSEVPIGNAFNQLVALSNTYSSYASSYEEAKELLLLSDSSNPSKILQGFLQMISPAIMPLTIEQHLDAPLSTFSRYKVQLELLLKETNEEHPDYQPLKEAVRTLNKIDERVQKSLEDSRMYIKIRSIRRSIVKLPQMNSRELDSFVSYGRKLIKEGTLMKQSRKETRMVQFWLFNDCLLYCTPITGSEIFSSHKVEGKRYKYNHLYKLNECRIQISIQSTKAIELFSRGKSFRAMCANETECCEWAETIGHTTLEYLKLNNIPERDFVAIEDCAPLWNQDENTSACCCCGKNFTMLRRRHHCRNCGRIVCGDCSPNRTILPTVSLTIKQRICKSCEEGTASEITGRKQNKKSIYIPDTGTKPLKSHTGRSFVDRKYDRSMLDSFLDEVSKDGKSSGGKSNASSSLMISSPPTKPERKKINASTIDKNVSDAGHSNSSELINEDSKNKMSSSHTNLSVKERDVEQYFNENSSSEKTDINFYPTGKSVKDFKQFTLVDDDPFSVSSSFPPSSSLEKQDTNLDMTSSCGIISKVKEEANGNDLDNLFGTTVSTSKVNYFETVFDDTQNQNNRPIIPSVKFDNPFGFDELLLEEEKANTEPLKVSPEIHEHHAPTSTKKKIKEDENIAISNFSRNKDIEISTIGKSPMENTEQNEPKQEKQRGMIALKDHPTYSNFFKLLKMTGNADMVKMKAQMAGVDSSALDQDPELLVPETGDIDSYFIIVSKASTASRIKVPQEEEVRYSITPEGPTKGPPRGDLLGAIRKGNLKTEKYTGHGDDFRPPMAGGLLADIQKGKSLQSVKLEEEQDRSPLPIGSKGGLLAEIQRGKALKSVKSSDTEPSTKNIGGGLSMLDQIKAGAKLKKVSATNEPGSSKSNLTPSSRQGDLLSQLQGGMKNLKKVEPQLKTKQAPTSTGGMGMMGQLSMAMEKRRKAMELVEDASDSSDESDWE